MLPPARLQVRMARYGQTETLLQIGRDGRDRLNT